MLLNQNSCALLCPHKFAFCAPPVSKAFFAKSSSSGLEIQEFATRHPVPSVVFKSSHPHCIQCLGTALAKLTSTGRSGDYNPCCQKTFVCLGAFQSFPSTTRSSSRTGSSTSPPQFFGCSALSAPQSRPVSNVFTSSSSNEALSTAGTKETKGTSAANRSEESKQRCIPMSVRFIQPTATPRHCRNVCNRQSFTVDVQVQCHLRWNVGIPLKFGELWNVSQPCCSVISEPSNFQKQRHHLLAWGTPENSTSFSLSVSNIFKFPLVFLVAWCFSFYLFRPLRLIQWSSQGMHIWPGRTCHRQELSKSMLQWGSGHQHLPG